MGREKSHYQNFVHNNINISRLQRIHCSKQIHPLSWAHRYKKEQAQEKERGLLLFMPMAREALTNMRRIALSSCSQEMNDPIFCPDMTEDPDFPDKAQRLSRSCMG